MPSSRRNVTQVVVQFCDFRLNDPGFFCHWRIRLIACWAFSGFVAIVILEYPSLSMSFAERIGIGWPGTVPLAILVLFPTGTKSSEATAPVAWLKAVN